MKGSGGEVMTDLRISGSTGGGANGMALEKVGQVLRDLRKARRMRLKDVADQVGCTVSMLSKIETGRASPSLRILHAIVTALGSNIAALFSSPADHGVVICRKGERPVAHVGPGGPGRGVILERLIPFGPGRVLEANIHRVMPGADNGGPIRHTGEEMGLVLEGELELTVGDQTYRIAEGDSFFFRSDIEHSYRNPSGRPASIVWINTPPTF